MKFITIDTSQKKGVVSLYREGFGFVKKEFDALEQQKVLIHTIDTLLQESELLLSDLDQIAICIGPGSFTGTRIGAMTGKTFAYANKLPLKPFNSLLPYHTPNTLTLLHTKDESCFAFDGTTLKKIYFKDLAADLTPLYSLNPDMLPFKTEQALYNLNNLISLSPSEEMSLIYSS